MKYYIIAGEPSGDLHGSNLMKALLSLDVRASFQYWGGKHMSGVAPGKVIDISETAIMGFGEVVLSLRKIKQFFKLTKETISTFSPDVVIFIDYPGFNLRMCKWAKSQGFKTVYYISPQLWAWKKGRKEGIRKYVDELLVILPFEQKWYGKEGITAHYVGHPLVEAIAQYAYQPISNVAPKKPILALLPGSRRQEINKILPEMLTAAAQVSSRYEVIVGGSSSIDQSFYEKLLAGSPARVIIGQTYDVLAAASVALVASGTATLETALHKVPQIVCYKTSKFNYMIGKWLVDLKYISLVNLILDKRAVPELIQSELNTDNILSNMALLESSRAEIDRNYSKLKDILTTDKTASEMAAEKIFNLIKQ